MGLKAQEGKYEGKVGSEVGRDTGGQRNRRQRAGPECPGKVWGLGRMQLGAWAVGIPQGPEKGQGPGGWGRLGAPGASHGANSAPSIRWDESNKLL